MRILHQSALISHSLFPPVPLLAAPTPPLQLSAPRFAGLLPFSTPRQVEIVIEEPITFDDLMRQLGPIRTHEEFDAEIAAIINNRMAYRWSKLQ
jgi:hypothetical protein